MLDWQKVLIIVAIVIIVWILYRWLTTNRRECINCLDAHIESGANYIWLTPLGHGRVLSILFEEPVNSGNWRRYTDQWWEAHCRVVDHHPDNLVKAHVDAFIAPDRFARLMFRFEDGTMTEPTEEFYELEAEYFRKYGC